MTLANGDKETRYYYQKNGEITNYTNVAIANVDVTVNGQPTWTDIVPGTKIDLPKTANNTAVADEWLKIENTTTGETSYVLAGTKAYEVTGDLAITTGYYQYFVDGEDYYTTAGHKTFAQLVTDLGLTVDGTGSLWTFDTYKDAYVSNATSGLDVSAYETVSLKTGYVLVDATAVATTAKVTVNGNEVTDLTAAFPVSVDDHVIVTNAGQVKGEWGPTTAQPIVGDITISTVA